jgi:hypothetical protein
MNILPYEYFVNNTVKIFYFDDKTNACPLAALSSVLISWGEISTWGS